MSTLTQSRYSSTSSKRDKLLVAAIDFGTTYSGYAFAFKHEYEEDPTKVNVNQGWVAGTMSLISLKAPTCVLCKSDGSFDSFGFEAENKYSELALDDNHHDWYFFRRFKMVLQDKKIRRDVEIEDDKGKKMKAKEVFTMAIRFLKNHLLELLDKRGTGINLDDIHWVLTVPAIWSDSAKQFMRQAAEEAGIEGCNLSIALEPEVASMYCHAASPAEAKKYMVIDLGGGTADITVHERLPDGSLKELHKASGGPWGGTRVDEEFNQLLIKVVGASTFTHFCDENKADQMDLQRELETKKRTITPESTGKITVKVPVSITSTYKCECGEDIKEAVKASPFTKHMAWISDKLRMDADLFRSFFKKCADSIVNHLKELMRNSDLKGVDTFLMVGGFSESPIIQEAIKRSFPNAKVIIPAEAGLAVLKGAVIFGRRPQAVYSRMAKYTYGINISPPFDQTIHPGSKRVVVGGMERCKDTFKRYIQVGEPVRIGEARTGKHVTIKPNQKEMLLKIYASPNTDPKFVDEDDCELLGKVVVKLPDSSEKLRVEVRMMFGETELMVEASESVTNTKVTAYFDFL